MTYAKYSFIPQLLLRHKVLIQLELLGNAEKLLLVAVDPYNLTLTKMQQLLFIQKALYSKDLISPHFLK